jgi:dCTP deaminase
MIISGLEIARRMHTDILIMPFEPSRVGPNSYNVTLAPELLQYTGDTLDMKTENPVTRLTIPDDGLVMRPGQLYLGRTAEYTETHNLVPMLEGRSSVGRLGVFIHVTAGFGDVGFCGFWTLELTCVLPVRIYAGVEIGQIFYHTIDGAFTPYRSKKYNHNTGVQASKLFQEFV